MRLIELEENGFIRIDSIAQIKYDEQMTILFDDGSTMKHTISEKNFNKIVTQIADSNKNIVSLVDL